MNPSREKKRDFFWLSYSDLMTSLFFVMLVLFVLVYGYQQGIINELAFAKTELDRIKKIDTAIKNVDKRYFVYDSINKKHILNIDFQFPRNIYNISKVIQPDNTISTEQLLQQFDSAGNAIKKLILRFPKEDNIKYLVVVEGQASRDGFRIDDFANNDVLSYHRAQSLINYWKKGNLNLDSLENLELIVAGSGEGGIPRIIPDKPPNNQRFLITIIPKIGEMKNKSRK